VLAMETRYHPALRLGREKAQVRSLREPYALYYSPQTAIQGVYRTGSGGRDGARGRAAGVLRDGAGRVAGGGGGAGGDSGVPGVAARASRAVGAGGQRVAPKPGRLVRCRGAFGGRAHGGGEQGRTVRLRQGRL